jgi:endothelin-converting enzyme
LFLELAINLILKHSYFSPLRLTTSTRSADEDNFDKMKSAYDACLDEATIKGLGIIPLEDVVKAIKASFPGTVTAGGILRAKEANAIEDTVLLLAKYGVSALVSTSIGPDDTDPDTAVVSVSPPWSMGLPSKERYEDEKLVQKYQEVVVEVLSSLISGQSTESFGKVVDFEKKLAAASPSTEEREDVTVVLPNYHCNHANAD